MQRFLFTVSTVSALNTWEHDSLLFPKYEEINSLQITSLAAYASETNK